MDTIGEPVRPEPRNGPRHSVVQVFVMLEPWISGGLEGKVVKYNGNVVGYLVPRHAHHPDHEPESLPPANLSGIENQQLRTLVEEAYRRNGDFSDRTVTLMEGDLRHDHTVLGHYITLWESHVARMKGVLPRHKHGKALLEISGNLRKNVIKWELVVIALPYLDGTV
jgi:hypothetical protein